MTAASSIVPLLMNFALQIIIIDEASQITEHAAVAVIANSMSLSINSSSLETIFNVTVTRRRISCLACCSSFSIVGSLRFLYLL